MKYTRIPHTDIRISKICLGTMTWGRQNTEDEAHEQMDYALDQGVNFFDTAELYPIPPKKELYAVTEEFIGNWFKKNGNRDKVVLATKIAGPGHGGKHIRSTWKVVCSDFKPIILICTNCTGPNVTPTFLDNEGTMPTPLMYGRITSIKFWKRSATLLRKERSDMWGFPTKPLGEPCAIWKKAKYISRSPEC